MEPFQTFHSKLYFSALINCVSINTDACFAWMVSIVGFYGVGYDPVSVSLFLRPVNRDPFYGLDMVC